MSTTTKNHHLLSLRGVPPYTHGLAPMGMIINSHHPLHGGGSMGLYTPPPMQGVVEL